MPSTKNIATKDYYVIHSTNTYAQDMFLMSVESTPENKCLPVWSVPENKCLPVWSIQEPIYKTMLFESYRKALNFLTGDWMFETNDNGEYKFTMDDIKKWRKEVSLSDIMQVTISVKPVPASLIAQNMTSSLNKSPDTADKEN